MVLPFANIGGDPEQEYFVDGVIESLTTDLSRIHGAFVIGRNTAFAYKGRSPDVRQIGRELNVRYVLEGSMQRSGNRLRINVQLIDADTGNHLWAERFDKAAADLFEMQDEIVSRLANALDAELVEAEARRAARSPHPDAMDLYFQGRACWNKGMTPEYLVQAAGFLRTRTGARRRQCRCDGRLGHGGCDHCRLVRQRRPSRQLAAAETIVIRALSIAPRHAGAHLALGAVLMFTNRAAHGIARMRTGAGARSQSGRRPWLHRHGQVFCRPRRRNRGPYPRSAAAVAARRLRLSLAAVRRNCQGAARRRRRGVDWLRRSIEANRNFPLAHFHLAEALALR